MRRIVIPTLSVMALFLGACGDDKPVVDKAAIEKSVKAVETSLMKAAATKDAAAWAANYTADAILMTPGEPAMRGTAAIRAGLSPMFADPALKLDFASDRVEISDSGDMAATHGHYTLTVTNPISKKLVTDKGNYVTVFRKQADASWKAVLDINTSEVPPTPPATPAEKKKPTAKKAKGKKR